MRVNCKAVTHAGLDLDQGAAAVRERVGRSKSALHAHLTLGCKKGGFASMCCVPSVGPLPGNRVVVGAEFRYGIVRPSLATCNQQIEKHTDRKRQKSTRAAPPVFHGCNKCTSFSVCQMCIARVLQRTIQYFAACQSN